MATFTALLSALPKLISLVSLIMSMVRDAEQRGIGRKEAIAEALVIAHRDITNSTRTMTAGSRRGEGGISDVHRS